MSVHIQRNMSLCIMCRNYCGGCPWSKYFLPVKGWTAIETYKKGHLNRAWVSWCPMFKADAGLYDLFVYGDPRKGRYHISKEYGHITPLRFTTIRYHLVNDYEGQGMTTKPSYRIVSHRCDKAMKRSKEKCWTPFRRRWRCNGECKTCICCLVKDENGDEHHIGANRWKAKNTWNHTNE